MDDKKIIDLLSDLKHRIFPRPFERLAVSGSGLVGVEVGIYKAEHAESLLRHLDIKRLYLVDPYEMYADYHEGKAHYGVDQDSLQAARLAAEKRLTAYAGKITWVRKLSVEATREIPDNLDFVYIDGNHAEDFVRQDILSYYPKVRKGGVLGGHDFYNGYCREHDGVVQAVSSFAVEKKLTLQVELPDWWIKK